MTKSKNKWFRFHGVLDLESILTFALLLVVSFSLKGQPVDSEETIKRIKMDVVTYLRANDSLEQHGNFKEYDERISIIECVEETVLGYSKVGIYVFGTATSHSKKYLLLKRNLEYEIIDPDDLAKVFQKVISFLVEQNVSSEKMAVYVESVIKIYRMNENRNPAKLDNKKH